MKKALILTMVWAMVAGCDATPAPSDPSAGNGDLSAAKQQEAVEAQKLSIEQAAEQATKLIEADAKAEIDAATTEANVPAQ